MAYGTLAECSCDTHDFAKEAAAMSGNEMYLTRRTALSMRMGGAYEFVYVYHIK